MSASLQSQSSILIISRSRSSKLPSFTASSNPPKIKLDRHHHHLPLCIHLICSLYDHHHHHHHHHRPRNYKSSNSRQTSLTGQRIPSAGGRGRAWCNRRIRGHIGHTLTADARRHRHGNVNHVLCVCAGRSWICSGGRGRCFR